MTGQSEKGRARLARAVLGLSFATLLSVLGLLAGLDETKTAPSATRAPEAVMTEFWTDRDALRTDEIAQLQALSDAPETDGDIRAMAQRRILLLRQWMEQEATIESVLNARGYAPVLATVHSDSVNVLVACDRLEQSDAAIILELASRETGITGGNIKIIPIN